MSPESLYRTASLAVFFISDEELHIGILGDLLYEFYIREAQPPLDIQRTKCLLRRVRLLTGVLVLKIQTVFLVDHVPVDHSAKYNPSVVFLQMTAKRKDDIIDI